MGRDVGKSVDGIKQEDGRGSRDIEVHFYAGEVSTF